MIEPFVFLGVPPGFFVQECARRRKRKRWGRSGKWKSGEAIENKETRVLNICGGER
jgi:hypothetical protein